MKLSKAVVTGATSFIGSALVRELISRHVQCQAIVRPESKARGVLPQNSQYLNIIRADAANPDVWIQQIEGADVFYHFAWDGIGAVGRADPEIQKRNVNMSVACLKAASEAGISRFIFSGSQAEYGIVDGVITEETPCRPEIEYGKGKLRFLQYALNKSEELAIEYVHLRIFSVYGPGDHPWTLVNRCIDTFQAGKEIELSSCVQPWNYLYVSDAASAIAEMAQCNLQGMSIFNIAGEETKPLKEYVEEIWKQCGGRGKPLYGQFINKAEKPHGIEPDIKRMLRITNWKQKISFADGIQTTIASR